MYNSKMIHYRNLNYVKDTSGLKMAKNLMKQGDTLWNAAQKNETIRQKQMLTKLSRVFFFGFMSYIASYFSTIMASIIIQYNSVNFFKK